LSKKIYGKVGNVPNVIMTVLPCLICKYKITGMLVLSSRTENDLPVVKDHGRTDFVDPCRVRSRRRHRSFQKRTEPISTETFLCKKQKRRSVGDIRYRVAEREVLVFY